MLDITFYGVRGSTPCSCDATSGFGGNTSCVYVGVGGGSPIVLDLGTGLRYLGERLTKELGSQPFVGTALLTHVHWDHVQGLPFFVPLLQDGAKLTIVGPPQEGLPLEETVKSFVAPPLFPVHLELLPGVVDFVETQSGPLRLGPATVSVAPVRHVGRTNGYRIQNGTGSLAYISDHQQPLDGSLNVPLDVVDLCRDVDVLIHDAQYSAEEFKAKFDWGHSTVDYAVAVAKAANVKRLVLFHHDPGHDDQWVAEAQQWAQSLAGPEVEVIAAAEGLTLRSGSDFAV